MVLNYVCFFFAKRETLQVVITNLINSNFVVLKPKVIHQQCGEIERPLKLQLNRLTLDRLLISEALNSQLRLTLRVPVSLFNATKPTFAIFYIASPG